ncbi:MAG: DUF2840 domain-containing protein [Castellaniella sp.]|nr:DUF2840 domain-containing protein [Pigmentiphaga sp.]
MTASSTSTMTAPPVPLTRVALASVGRHIRIRLRFGAPQRIVRLDAYRRLAIFLPGDVCCRLSWAANAYGTVAWTLIVMQAATPLDTIQRIAGVTPGARLLLRVDGKPQVTTVLALIDAIEAQGIAPVAVSPAYWRTVANRLAVRQAPPAYTAERHAAYLARRALQAGRHA